MGILTAFYFFTHTSLLWFLCSCLTPLSEPSRWATLLSGYVCGDSIVSPRGPTYSTKPTSWGGPGTHLLFSECWLLRISCHLPSQGLKMLLESPKSLKGSFDLLASVTSETVATNSALPLKPKLPKQCPLPNIHYHHLPLKSYLLQQTLIRFYFLKFHFP